MRASPLLEYSSTTLAIVTIVGSCTALFAASIALVHNDIKKVIAYSTMSQLGYTFLACGISQYDIAIFHIVNHGFFKALLFLSAGIYYVLALNSAIFLKLLDLINNLRQLAGNLFISLIGILRGHTLKIICYKKIFNLKFYSQNSSSDKYNSKFSSYLAGLIEGNGCIWIPINRRDKNNKLISPVIDISFNSKDLPLIIMLQNRLETGNIYKKKGKNSYSYRISNYNNLIKIINIINGYMRTPKIYQLYKLIDYLNEKNYNLKKLPIDNSSLDSNAWLAGFIDADGHFSVRVSIDKENKLKRIACSLEIEQRQKDLNNKSLKNIMSLMGNFLLCNIKETKITTKNPKYRIRTCNINGNLILISYLNKFPLFSSKYLDYLDWLKVFDLFKNKEYKNNIIYIQNIKMNMNNRRTFFTWNHLQKFYNLYD